MRSSVSQWSMSAGRITAQRRRIIEGDTGESLFFSGFSHCWSFHVFWIRITFFRSTFFHVHFYLSAQSGFQGEPCTAAVLITSIDSLPVRIEWLEQDLIRLGSDLPFWLTNGAL